MPRVPDNGPLSDGEGAPIKLTPLHPEVREPKILTPYLAVVHSFSITDDGRRNHRLIPSRDRRPVRTGLQLDIPRASLPLASTPPALEEMKLMVSGYQIDSTTGELSIFVQSFHHEAVNLPHGTPLAHLHFTSLRVI